MCGLPGEVRARLYSSVEQGHELRSIRPHVVVA